MAREQAKLSYFKLDTNVPYLEPATEGSACFDLAANIKAEGYKHRHTAYNSSNGKVFLEGQLNRRAQFPPLIHIPPLWRVCIRTGYIFDIPKGFSVRLFARSSTPLKRGLMLANGVGVIDSDYVDEIMIMFVNMSNTLVTVAHGDRLAQGELIPAFAYSLHETKDKPERTTRDGGFGSTGN